MSGLILTLHRLPDWEQVLSETEVEVDWRKFFTNDGHRIAQLILSDFRLGHDLTATQTEKFAHTILAQSYTGPLPDYDGTLQAVRWKIQLPEFGGVIIRKKHYQFSRLGLTHRDQMLREIARYRWQLDQWERHVPPLRGHQPYPSITVLRDKMLVAERAFLDYEMPDAEKRG